MIKTNYDLSAEERAAHEAKWGGFNDFPPGWKEIDAKEFAKSPHFGFNPDLREYRQMLRSKEFEHAGCCVTTHLYFYFDGRGYALVNDFWEGTVKFFMFGELNPHAYDNFDTSD